MKTYSTVLLYAISNHDIICHVRTVVVNTQMRKVVYGKVML